MQWLCVYFIYSIIWFWQQNKKSSTYSAVPSMSTSAYRHTLWPLAFSVIVGLFQNLGFEAHFKSKTLLKTESASEKNKELCRIRSMCVWWHTNAALTLYQQISFSLLKNQEWQQILFYLKKFTAGQMFPASW